ncbi:hypothetical protein FTV88_0438 [Heliorestis convoluta]|uniref:Uncharacterized protein n=1 Tax=Heliorestis convoluta TaxID=356322 RepID=A0A5Q2MWF4_9FIRM|nr:hypothetical protein FTV88_0438 [Heliorestis convoluta]
MTLGDDLVTLGSGSGALENDKKRTLSCPPPCVITYFFGGCKS